ncbi:UPF0764 protein C16orf89 homolog [Trichosurus vulpecula]|uniref:UPF0764 protein C16orf89 homolog n=1 Tax=Trichosurus vulpecula TaxID=9337 RepID=UPI00186AEB9D|nr:UPF0764 protein C16orf89 homolog [Trichosurus vulpecula]
MNLVVLLLLMLLLPPLSLQNSNPSDTKVATGKVILSALEKATSYFEKRYREFNLDSLVGFLMLKEQLTGVLEKWAHDPQVKSVTLSVEELLKRLSIIIPRAKVFLKIVDFKYLKEFQETLRPKFWKLPHSWSHTNTSMIYSKFDNSNPFPAKFSDSCMTLLLGTKEKNGQPCRITDYCMGIMTAPGRSGEELVKQLFYFLIAKMKECSNDLFLRSKYYMDVFCANMMELNLRREKNGLSFRNRSFFMTYIMLCGFSGYSDFYKIQWIKTILNWQNSEEGCYWKIFVVGNQPLMRGNRPEGGCSSLNTAAAVASLGGFLYYFTENSQTIKKLH